MDNCCVLLEGMQIIRCIQLRGLLLKSRTMILGTGSMISYAKIWELVMVVAGCLYQTNRRYDNVYYSRTWNT
jgi:hypothetical protein